VETPSAAVYSKKYDQVETSREKKPVQENPNLFRRKAINQVRLESLEGNITGTVLFIAQRSQGERS